MTMSGRAPQLPPNKPRIAPPGARAPDIPGSPTQTSSWTPYLYHAQQANEYVPYAPGPAAAPPVPPPPPSIVPANRQSSLHQFPYTSLADSSTFSANSLSPPMMPSHTQSLSVPSTPRPRTLSSFDTSTATMAFPQPSSFDRRGGSYLASPSSQLVHRHSRSDVGHQSVNGDGYPRSNGQTPRPPALSPQMSVASFDSQSIDEFADDNDAPVLSALNLNSQEGIIEGLRLFQSGRVPDAQAEWYNFVPKAAIESLDKAEVERQSVIFELIKAEQEYVEDLRLVQEVFVNGLRMANPPVLPPVRMKGFINQVFGGIDRILRHHQRQLAALFDRQLEQHPLVQSLADIVLDNTLKFVPEYESYMKNSPIALELHRKELARTPLYAAFLSRSAADPRLRRRDIKTLLSRPVTRLPRLKLVLERILKRAPEGHEDHDVLPIAIGVLDDFIRSTQPGMQVSESKVKFWDICESLVWARGEIIDPDLYDDERALVYTGPLARRNKSGGGWTDLVGALLDNYLLLLQVDDSHGRIRRRVVSRPIPLEYLRLIEHSFNDASESRRDRDGSILPSLSLSSGNKTQWYPFTIYHAGSPTSRRYTLYTQSDSMRKNWHGALVDAIGVRRARGDANRWFAEQVLEDGSFRQISTRVRYAEGTRFTGKVVSAAAFTAIGRSFLAVATATGVYVGPRSSSSSPSTPTNNPQPSFRRVFTHSATRLSILQPYNHLIVHIDRGNLLAYNLDLLARVSVGEATTAALDGSLEVLANDGDTMFMRVGEIRGRSLLAYASKGLLHVTLHTLEAVKPGEAVPPKRGRKAMPSYRPYGASMYVPRDSYDATFLNKGVAVIGERSIAVADPTSATPGSISKSINTIPDWSLSQSNEPMSALKARVEGHRLLGVERIDENEMLLVYDELGCFLDKHGRPSRNAGYVRWEAVASSYAMRGPHLLLFAASGTFVEIRLAARGRLVQVVEGVDIRIVSCTTNEKEPLLFAARGKHEDSYGLSERIVELVQTAPLGVTQAPPVEAWDSWDMP